MCYNDIGDNVKKLLLLFFISSFFLIGCSGSKNIELEFDSSPSSGYTWIYEIEDPNVLKVNEEFDIDDDCINEKGCTGKQIFNIIGIQKGETKIIFKYTNLKNVKYTKEYNIEVSNDLLLKESK